MGTVEIWVVKYWKTKGIYKVNAEVMLYNVMKFEDMYLQKGQYFFTEKEARHDVLRKAKLKRKSFEKQIAKIAKIISKLSS